MQLDRLVRRLLYRSIHDHATTVGVGPFLEWTRRRSHEIWRRANAENEIRRRANEYRS
jgi:hypothetical protein